MDNIYCIYCYTNTINNKVYIGQSKNVIKRCQPANYKGCTKFYNAIQKYGWENFVRTILADNLTLEEANQLEEEFITQYNSIENGYNIKSGGLNNNFSTESRQKMSNSCKTKRKIICLETQEIFDSAKEIERLKGFANANIIACCRGKLHTAYKFHWAYYEDFLSNNVPSSIDKRTTSVYCVELNKTFKSLADAEKELGIHHENISRCCQGILQTTGGYHWRYGN